MGQDNQDFVNRLDEAFGNATMADVARRLGSSHATVRNYYLGRMPAPEALIKIAKATGISLNWLLIGTGSKYAENARPLDLGKIIEEKIDEMIDKKLANVSTSNSLIPVSESSKFDIAGAVQRLDDPQLVMSEWFAFESREYPADFGIVFFRGWESFSESDKVDAVIDAKKALDRSIDHA